MGALRRAVVSEVRRSFRRGTEADEMPAGDSRRGRRRLWLPLALAGCAVALAGLALVGPAKHQEVHVSWPVRASAQPTQLVYAPLDVARRTPKRLSLVVPCVLPRSLADSRRDGRTVILATGRDPDADRVVVVERRAGELVARQGTLRIARLRAPVDAAFGGPCAWTLMFADRTWTITHPSGRSSLHTVDDPPLVNGFFSEVRAEPRAGPRAFFVARGTGTSPRTRQVLFAGLAVFLVAATLALTTGVLSRPHGGFRRPRFRAREVDAVVVGTLLVWWVVGPSFYDDGWTRIRLMNYEAAGTFSNYFSVNGESLPLGYWVDWPMHWLATATDVVPLLRLPALLAVIAGWAIARWALGCCSPDAAASLPGRCTLAGVYLVGSVAWLVTLRPEPMVALLTVGSLAAAVSFAKRPSARSLAVGAVLTAFAVSLHPAGFVVAAPFIASAPLLVRWIGAAPRERVAACAAITFSGGALAVVLVGLDSDLGTLAAATREFRAGTEHGANWRAEILRYSGLDLEGWNTPPRRLFVAFALLAALAYAARRHRERRWPEDLPALAVVAALALLVATPSKWPWHFGALVGLAAVAMAVEAQRFIAAGAGSRVGAFVRPLAAIALVTTATTWAAVNPTPWAALDLRTLEWGAEVGPFHLGSTKQWAAAVILALAAGAVWRLARGHSVAALPWRYAAWILPVAAASVVVPAAAMFVRDAVDTPGWTLARQSVDGLLDRSTCGIGDEAVVADPASLRPLQPVASTPPPPARGAWLADERPPVPGLRTWDSVGAAGGVARFETPWFLAPASRPIGLFVAGRLEGRVGARVQWGRSVGDRVKPLASRAIRLRDEVAGSPLSPWSLVPAKRMPSRPAGATHVRMLAVDRDIQPAAWLGVSGPVSYARTSLAAVARRAGVTLVHPRLNLYLPCARLPRLAGGRAERAHLLVLPSGSPWPVGDSNSPFNLDEAARVVELPLDETPDEIEGLRVYSLVWSPRPGEEVVPASTRVVTD